MSEHGTQTSSDNFVDAEFTEEKGLEVVKSQAQLSVRHEVSPAQFAAEIANRRQLKKILLDYVREDLKEGHHFYYASKFGKPITTKEKEGEKPSLNKEGALNVCHTLRCFPGKTEFTIEREAGSDHITVYADAMIYNAEGTLIATGRGSCSSRESKYRYRWIYERDVPRDLDKSTLQSRSGQGWKQYRVENTDIADLENTIIKMADKRAFKGAVDKLPIVSDIFAPAPDIEDLDLDQDTSQQPASKPASTPVPQQSPSAAGQSSSPDDDEVAAMRAAVEGLLKVKFGGDVDEIAKYLNGRDPKVMLPSALESMRAALAAM